MDHFHDRVHHPNFLRQLCSQQPPRENLDGEGRDFHDFLDLLRRRVRGVHLLQEWTQRRLRLEQRLHAGVDAQLRQLVCEDEMDLTVTCWSGCSVSTTCL